MTATQKSQPPHYDAVFRLEATGPSVNITGEYTLTLLADSTCTGLPDVARKRTYKLAIAPHPFWMLPLYYEGILSGASFYRANDFRFDIGVSGSSATLLIGEYGNGFTEDLGGSTVEIWGLVDASVNGSSSSGSFGGAFTYCDGLPLGFSGTYWHCPVPPVYCETGNHRFTLTR